MSTWDRFYWFRYNLIRFIPTVIVLPFWYVYDFVRLLKVLITTDGSSTLGFPHEMDWEWK